MSNNIGWYFAIENDASDRFVDEFADSKFNIDRWVSFTREIIQNSLDVADPDLEPRQPVFVKMEYMEFTKADIPGCSELEDCIRKALNGAIENRSNRQTINRYQRALELLETNKIPCLKVSDYRTLGVKSGRDEEWGALVFDEGKSRKNRPGSAGSHGVGKKAPFIISALNTVFYSTYNKADEFLFQGKTSLINWNDDHNVTRSGKGFYGIVDENNPDRKKRVSHLSKDDRRGINPFFVRDDVLGTDVVIVGVALDDVEKIKSRIINSVLENFFVAVKGHLLELDVFGQEIKDDNLDDCITQYYQTSQRNFTRIEGMERSIFGNLLNYEKAFSEEPITFDLAVDGVRYGKCSLHFLLENDKNRKYYCIFRNHGMKICDVNLSKAEQPFSAVVYLDDCPEDGLQEEKRLNARLSEVENAAHDRFVVDDEEFTVDPITKSLVEQIYTKVNEIILDKTKIEATDETPLEGLDEMLAIQGVLESKLSSQKITVKKRKNRIRKKGLGKKAEDYEEGVTNVGGRTRRHNPFFNEGENKPAKEGSDFKATLFRKFSSEPRFIRVGDTFKLILNPTEDAVADVKILPISVEGSINYIPGLVVSANDGDHDLSFEDNVIKDVVFKKDKSTSITIKILNNYNYALECDAFVEGKSND